MEEGKSSGRQDESTGSMGKGQRATSMMGSDGVAWKDKFVLNLKVGVGRHNSRCWGRERDSNWSLRECRKDKEACRE